MTTLAKNISFYRVFLMVFHKTTATTLGKMAFFAIKAKKGPIRTTFKTQCKKHQKHSVKWPFLKKMLYPLRQKRSFFRAFFKVFSKHSVFNRQNTKKNDVFDKPKKVRVRKRPFYRAFLLVFYR